MPAAANHQLLRCLPLCCCLLLHARSSNHQLLHCRYLPLLLI
jgi:hypothetical protein